MLQGEEKEEGREVLAGGGLIGPGGDGAEVEAGAESGAMVAKPRRRIEPHEKAEIIKQYIEEGRSVAEIGRDLGIERSAVHHAIARARLLKPLELNSYITEIFEHSARLQADLVANLASEEYRATVEPKRLRFELELFRVISERFQKLMATVEVVKQHHPQRKTPERSQRALRPGVIDGELIED